MQFVDSLPLCLKLCVIDCMFECLPEGELVILAPGLTHFGEDPEIDRLIREFGYRTTPDILKALEGSRDLMKNLSAGRELNNIVMYCFL